MGHMGILLDYTQSHILGDYIYIHIYIPEGSKDSNNGVSGPKYYNIDGIWALKPHDLGPWTLRIDRYIYIYLQNRNHSIHGGILLSHEGSYRGRFSEAAICASAV